MAKVHGYGGDMTDEPNKIVIDLSKATTAEEAQNIISKAWPRIKEARMVFGLALIEIIHRQEEPK